MNTSFANAVYPQHGVSACIQSHDAPDTSALPVRVPGLNCPRHRAPRSRAPQGLAGTAKQKWRRNRASNRELKRIKEIRVAQEILAGKLPRSGNEKFSKVQVLRYAKEYIELLREMMDSSSSTASESLATTVPLPDYPAQCKLQQQFSAISDDSDFSGYSSISSPGSISSSFSSASGGSISPGPSMLGQVPSNLSLPSNANFQYNYQHNVQASLLTGSPYSINTSTGMTGPALHQTSSTDQLTNWNVPLPQLPGSAVDSLSWDQGLAARPSMMPSTNYLDLFSNPRNCEHPDSLNFEDFLLDVPAPYIHM